MSSVYSGEGLSSIGRMRQVVLRARPRALEIVHAAGFTELTEAKMALFRYGGPDGRRPSDIAQTNGISKQTVNDLLGQLEGFGYLVREPDPEDGRGRIVRLTERGQAARSAVYGAYRMIEDAWRELVGEEDWQVFREVLERLALWDGLAGVGEAPAALAGEAPPVPL
jgi:DNA-binding MarR family transcriptional regulator